MFESLTSLSVARRWRQQRHPMPTVVALIRRENAPGAARYLLIQRQTEPYAGKWALVGGGWDFGETLETAIRREVREETGLETVFVALRGVVNERVAPSGAEGDGGHFIIFVCQLSAPTGVAREQSEGPVGWFSSQELLELRASGRIVPSDYVMLEHFGALAALSFVEAEVLAGDGADAPDKLARFEVK
jgi:ADP-ribose pyrophosphatase YjhB (NUDIX family)